MYAIMDTVFAKKYINCGYIPDSNNSDIESLSLIITHFIKSMKKNIYVAAVSQSKDLLENNIVISYCYFFELSYLNKYGIFPKKYIDLNYHFNIGTLSLHVNSKIYLMINLIYAIHYINWLNMIGKNYVQ